MSFDEFLDMFEKDLIELWKSTTHYITTDFGSFIELKYNAFLRRGTL